MLHVRVQPRASKDVVVGWHDGRLKVRLTAPPVEGAANAACLRFLASWLGVPRSSVSLLAGEKHREKTILVTGDPATLKNKLASLEESR